MKQFFRLFALLLILGSTTGRAEDVVIVHNFTSLVSESKIAFSARLGVANAVGKVDDGVVYTCTGSNNAKFFSPSVGEFALNLGARMDSVTTTRIANLKEIKMINVSSSGLLTTDIKLKLSTDGSTWGDAIEFTQGKKTYGATFPKGDYYVKLYNSTSPSSAIYITELRFVTEPEDCNCFVYTP